MTRSTQDQIEFWISVLLLGVLLIAVGLVVAAPGETAFQQPMDFDHDESMGVTLCDVDQTEDGRWVMNRSHCHSFPPGDTPTPTATPAESSASQWQSIDAVKTHDDAQLVLSISNESCTEYFWKNRTPELRCHG